MTQIMGPHTEESLKMIEEVLTDLNDNFYILVSGDFNFPKISNDLRVIISQLCHILGINRISASPNKKAIQSEDGAPPNYK